MKSFVCSIRDLKMAAFLAPFTVPTEAVGVRMFGDEVKRKESNMSAHPEDYVLFRVGMFDDETGVLSSEPAVQLSLGSDHANFT